MKKLILAFSLVLFPGLCLGFNSGTTKDGYFACVTKVWLDDLMSFVAANDIESAEAYRSANKCIILKGGQKATIVDRKIGTVQIAIKGIKLWTVSEAIELD